MNVQASFGLASSLRHLCAHDSDTTPHWAALHDERQINGYE